MAHVVFTTIASIDDLPNAHWQAGDNQSYANTMARIPARQDIRLIARQGQDKSIQLQYASNGRGDWQIVNGWHLVLAKFFTEKLKQHIATLPEGAPLQSFIESIDEPKAAHAAQQLIALECGINVTKEPLGALHRAVQIVQASLCALGVPCAGKVIFVCCGMHDALDLLVQLWRDHIIIVPKRHASVAQAVQIKDDCLRCSLGAAF